MVRVSSPAKLRPWSELTAKMVMGVVPGLVTNTSFHLEADCFSNSSGTPYPLSKLRGWGSKRTFKRVVLSTLLIKEVNLHLLY